MSSRSKPEPLHQRQKVCHLDPKKLSVHESAATTMTTTKNEFDISYILEKLKLVLKVVEALATLTAQHSSCDECKK